MPDVLTQSQIDELLNNLQSGEINEEQEDNSSNGRRVKEYDFKTPKKLTKEQLKILLGIHENFARHLASYFSGILRTYCEISVSSIEELIYYEYNNALPDAVMIAAIDVDPIEGSILVDMSNSIAFGLISRLLGGNGDTMTLDREYTEIEISLISRIYKQIAIFMKEAWSGFIPAEAHLKQIETNARLIQSISMEQVVILVLMDVSIWSIKGTIAFCIPCINLESIIDQINKNQYRPSRQYDNKQEEMLRDEMLKHIKGSQLELSGLFGETTLTIQEITNLQVGDVIRFDQSADSDVRLNIGGKTWFYGVPGTKKNKKVIKIKSVI